jgi:hypothetical protein
LARAAGEDSQDFRTGGTLPGVKPQKAPAKRAQVVGNAVHKIGGLGRLEADLVREHRVHGPLERKTAGKRLEQHDPDGVPVSRGRERLDRCLFRGHIQDCSGDHALGGLKATGYSGIAHRWIGGLRLAAQRGDQAEIQQDDAAVGAHQDILGFQVPVQHIQMVKDKNALAELANAPRKRSQSSSRRRVPRGAVATVAPRPGGSLKTT